MTPYQKAITGIDEKARDKLIRGLTMTKPATPTERTTQYYACEHDIPNGCQFCHVTPGYSRASFLDLLAERDRFKDAFLTSSAECERVIAERDSLKSDRARLIAFIAKIEDELKVLGKLRDVDLLFRKARSLLRELEEPK